jgi:hypothetical protein
MKEAVWVVAGFGEAASKVGGAVAAEFDWAVAVESDDADPRLDLVSFHLPRFDLRLAEDDDGWRLVKTRLKQTLRGVRVEVS